MTTTKEINKSELYKIAYRNHTSEAIFNVLACRERARPETDLRRLKIEMVHEGFKVVPTELIETFKELDKNGIGRLIQRPGKPPRFYWHFNLKEVGRMAIENPSKPLAATLKEHTVQKGGLTKNERAPINKTLVAVLLDNRHIQLDFPSDLTKKEAAFVADLLMRDAK